MRVLVTGGAGFIGSHVVEALINRRYDVTVIDNFSSGRREWIAPGAEFVECDVTDRERVAWIFSSRKIEGVFHLAAMSRVLPSINAGAAGCAFSAEQNILGTINVLAASVEARVKRFIYSASSTVYGLLPAPHHENMPPAGHTPYAISKYAGELYALQFDRQFDLPVLCLRYFQVYGPRQPTAGEYAMVTGIFLDQKARGLPLTIHGDGRQRRDFVHVLDVAAANVAAIESKARRESINIGTGESHSIGELAGMISPDFVTYAPARAHDMRETRADIAKAQRLIGWRPTIAFEAGTRALMKGNDA